MNYVIRKKIKINPISNSFSLEGYTLQSKNKCLSIGGNNVRSINIINKKMAYPFVSKVVRKKYEKLINILTELIVSDDDSGNSIVEILNMIEKFKQEVKNKYRSYLKRKELEEMGEKLMFFQKQAKKKEIELARYYNSRKRNIPTK